MFHPSWIVLCSHVLMQKRSWVKKYFELLRKIEVATCNHQADSQLYVWPDVLIWWFASSEKVWSNMTPTEMSLLRPGVIKQHKTKPDSSHCKVLGQFQTRMAKYWVTNITETLMANYITLLFLSLTFYICVSSASSNTTTISAWC